jgi:hypothetical protein
VFLSQRITQRKTELNPSHLDASAAARFEYYLFSPKKIAKTNRSLGVSNYSCCEKPVLKARDIPDKESYR